MTEGRVSELDMIAETFKTEEQRRKRLKKTKNTRSKNCGATKEDVTYVQ